MCTTHVYTRTLSLFKLMFYSKTSAFASMSAPAFKRSFAIVGRPWYDAVMSSVAPVYIIEISRRTRQDEGREKSGRRCFA